MTSVFNAGMDELCERVSETRKYLPANLSVILLYLIKPLLTVTLTVQESLVLTTMLCVFHLLSITKNHFVK